MAPSLIASGGEIRGQASGASRQTVYSLAPNEAVSSPLPSMPCLCLLGLCSYLAVYTSSFVFCLEAWSES